MTQTKNRTEEPTFEENLERLESIVQHLEEGNVDLDKSIQLYEEGVLLSKICMKKLNEAEKKMVQLQKKLTNDATE